MRGRPILSGIQPMPITVACPTCSTQLKTPDHLGGRTVLCPKCKGNVVVPSGAGQTAALPVALLGGSSRSAPVAKEVSTVWSVVGYFVRDQARNESGPFSFEELQRRANSNQLFPSWYVSTDRVRWTVAANVPKLFDVLEAALASQLPPESGCVT